jgi:site-specific DNA recombinase
MKSAYLYVRVSTDEQKRRGYSLPEQEERLLKHCGFNNIEVKGIYREDYSAKNFKRPEWKSLLNTLKKDKNKPAANVLFVKWDRFSRNIEYAYQMLGILRNINVQAMAIDQPIDFTVPESTVTLAVYLSVPEAENGRRALNTSDGMRRAKMTGRHIGKAPTGYANMTATDGKKYIIPKHPEADLIRWCFRKIANGDYPTDQVRKMACKKGLQCEKSNFWRLMRNPIYCGLIIIPAYQNQERQVIKALHEPLISENLFYEAQDVLNKKHRQKGTKNVVIEWFPLRGFLKCPLCHRTLTGSFSKGKYRRYPYYHCMGSNCKARFKAELLNEAYEIELKKYRLVPGVKELFNHVLTDGSLLTNHEYLYEQRLIRRQIQEQELLISQARKFFLRGEIDADDFRKIKKEYHDISIELNSELDHLTRKLNDDNNLNMGSPSFANLLQWYQNQEIEDKRNIISMITPENISADYEILGSLNLNEALSKIMVCNA